jgi:hypothetical protein
MATNSDSSAPLPPQCQRCYRAMQPIYAILDPTSGKRYRTFKCAECGRSEMTEYRNA